MKRWTWMMSVLMCLGCLAAVGCEGTLTDEQGRLDVDRALGVVEALERAGFEGDVAIRVGGAAEAYMKNSFGLGNPGGSVEINGKMKPRRPEPPPE